MKKVFLIATALLVGAIASAQFSGIQRGQQAEPLPEGLNLLHVIHFYHNTRQ
jgi:hypothetical protein